MTRRGQEWMDEALCAQVGSDLWFPEKGGSNANAKRICQVCPVQAECAAHALTHDEYGVWGGTTERERGRAGGGCAPRVEKTCVVCGDTFLGGPKRVTCSPTCSARWHKGSVRRKAS